LLVSPEKTLIFSFVHKSYPFNAGPGTTGFYSLDDFYQSIWLSRESALAQSRIG
jgi:hypothetical protein